MASSTAGTAAAAAEPIRLKAKRVTAENFRPFGQARLPSCPRSCARPSSRKPPLPPIEGFPLPLQLVEAGEDGAVFGPEDAQLVLTNGRARAAGAPLPLRSEAPALCWRENPRP